MSILDTKHEDARLIDSTIDQETSTALSPASKPVVVASVESKRPPRTPGWATRLFAALRQVNSAQNIGSLFTEPAIYDEYRTSVARRNAARGSSLRD